jgi:malonate-semialdehyde dehydrogenase (acetylating)/methylmalonate-semialdehyde dehydrogenase
MVVLPDANMSEAAEAAVSAGYGSAGERCMAVSVLVAVGGCGDELVEGIRRRVDGLAVGSGTDPRPKWVL